jgi:penicillin-binding protein 1A
MQMTGKTWKISISVLLTIVVPGVLFIVSVYSGAFGHLQSRKELLNFKNATASIVQSSQGEIIGRFYSENRTNVSFKQIPPYLIDALIATEDARFFKHKGIDSRSLARVLFKTILSGNSGSGGGSTITQQLAKNMFGRKKNGTLAMIINKVREIILAYRIEKTYSKEEILTLYLNTVPFGENIFGIETAASQYFNKKVEELKIEEAAVLIGMLKATTFYHPVLHPENAKNRRNIVINQMEKYSYLKPSDADSLRALSLILDYNNADKEGIADYFLIQVKNEAKRILHDISSATGKNWDPEVDGLIITTTLNLPLQTYANKAFHEHLSVMQNRLSEQFKTPSGRKLIGEITESRLKGQKLTNRADEINMRTIFDWNGSHNDSISVRDSISLSLTLLHAGLLAIDPQTGAVLAWVGGIDFNTQQYDQILARRQLGSVFKPILFAEAFEEGMEPCQYLDNDSVVLSGFEDWSPENFDHSYGGRYSLAGALAKSMNVPAFSLFLKVGFDKLDSLWTKMGFSFPLVNNPSLALGTAEASIREIAVAYSSFANGGYKINPRSIVSITSSDGKVIYQNYFSEARTRVLTERTGLLLSAILRKAVMEGTGVSMKSLFGVTSPLAGKTGTSQNYSDAWFAAFNPKMTIIARVGASSPGIHFNSSSNGTGSALALPLVALTLKSLESDEEAGKQLLASFPELPAELAAALDCPDFKKESFFDNFLDLFKKKEIIYNTDSAKTVRRNKSFFKRLFRR